MKFIYLVILVFFFQSCSFDNKSGIWKNEKKISQKNDSLSQFRKLTTNTEIFNETIPISKSYKFKIKKETSVKSWKDIFLNSENNFENFDYNFENELMFKSKRLSRNKINNYILYDQGNVIFTDKTGKIITYSISKKKITNIFNFYRKKYKGVIKNLNIILEDNIIYVSDNIGYLYAFDYKMQKVLWAKNTKVPFRSNLKIYDDKLIAANQNNNLFFFKKDTGDIVKLIPTEETLVNNQFVNNLAITEKDTLFLNSYGSLYSINNDLIKINWFVNLNQTLDLNPSNLFISNQLVISNKKLAVSSNKYLYVIDVDTGSIIFRKNFSSIVKPVITKENLFLITRNNLLVSLDLKNGNIIYSRDINEEISEYFNTKKKSVKFKQMVIANNSILVLLENSYVLKFNVNGKLELISKLPSKLNTNSIIIDSSLVYLDFSNKVSIIN